MTSQRKLLVSSILWLVFLNGVIASLISIQAVFDANLLGVPLSFLYFILQQIGHFQFLSLLVAIPLIVISMLIPSKRLVWLLATIIFSAFILITFTDYAVYKLYRFHLNGMVWQMLTGGGIKEIFVFDVANVVTFILIIAGIALLQLGLLAVIQIKKNKVPWINGWWVFLLVLVVQVSGQSIYAWSDAWYKTEIISQVRFIPLPQPVTIKRYLRKRGWAPEIPQGQPVKITASGQFNYPTEPMQCTAPEQKPNILFIVADGLRFDMLDTSVMPVWSKLAEKSQIFEHHLSTGNATRFGIYGLFTGLFSHYWFDSLNTKTSSVLITELKRQQYQFGFFANARLSSPEFDRAIFSTVSEFIPKKTSGDSVIKRDYKIVQLATSFIEKNKDNPFFSFVFFDAPHAYVSPPQDKTFTPELSSLNYLSINNETDPQPFLNRYKNSIHFIDRLTGNIIDTLDKQGLLENTIIIMTGDHGQEANETRTNSWGHNSNFSKYQIQVPMVVYWPGKQGKKHSQLTSHVDIVPTLMKEAFACTNDLSTYTNGQSLFTEKERGFVLINNWNDQAIANKKTITVFKKLGPTERYNFDDYQSATSDDNSALLASEVMQSMSRFYK